MWNKKYKLSMENSIIVQTDKQTAGYADGKTIGQINGVRIHRIMDVLMDECQLEKVKCHLL